MSDLKSQLRILVTLQNAEIEIKRNEQELARIDDRVNSLNAELSDYQNRVADQEKTLTDLKKQYRSDENEVQMIETQIIKSKEKLGAVKTNKEYQSMLKEIDELNDKSSQMEDQMLVYLDQIESSEKALTELKADLADVGAEVKEKQAEIRTKAEGQRKDLEALVEQRDKVWADITPKIQGVYQSVKRQSNGIAMAEIADGTCQACRMNIPPQLFHEILRMDTMRMCPHCQRIVYPRALAEMT